MQPAQSSETGEFDFESQTVLLNSGWRMPIIGLGTWTLSDDQAENSVYHALKCGMRLIDTARFYGNEVGVGLTEEEMQNIRDLDKQERYENW